ncbi:glycosyltransferase family 2 protein [Flavobacterium sp. UBA7680]|uniref:glycosyltransferase family 2 protein n=1 Tax=Flavobacterium sp. UBA7680 TaxID=1946559 RepID=UPI0025BFEA06|nr:glycosyltransferase family 2 protein [Flavobacterium sp. UBA7680]
MKSKLISVITVVYNNVELIEDTIKSVLSYERDSFEYIIIDGGSTDGTVEVINKYLDRISTFITEKDKGIYDAMNKGISHSNGTFVYFINCGDRLLNLPIKELSDNISNDINCFPVELSSGKKLIPSNGFMLKLKNTLPHQGCFYKKSKDLKYDLDYKVFSDFNLNQQIYQKKGKIVVFSEPVVAFHDMGGISHDKKYSKEIFKVVNNNFGVKYKFFSWVYFKKRGLIHRFKNI